MKRFIPALTILAASTALAQTPEPAPVQAEAPEYKPITRSDVEQILKSGTPAQLDELLTNGISPNTRFHPDGTPLLVLAAYSSKLEMVQLLLSREADVNMAQPPGITALSVAAATNNIHMLDLLLSHGANINYRASQGDSVLMLACSQNSIDAVQVMLAMKADPNLADVNGVTPLIYTIARCKEPEIITLMLLEHGANPNAAMKDGTTALMAAAMQGSANCVRLLLEHGADPSMLDADGNTAYNYAATEEVKQLLAPADEQ